MVEPSTPERTLFPGFAVTGPWEDGKSGSVTPGSRTGLQYALARMGR